MKVLLSLFIQIKADYDLRSLQMSEYFTYSFLKESSGYFEIRFLTGFIL